MNSIVDYPDLAGLPGEREIYLYMKTAQVG